MNRNILFNIVKIFISIALLSFIFAKLDTPTFFASIRQANLGWLFGALVAVMVAVVIRAYRWQVLLTAIGVSVPLFKLTGIYFIGFLFNNILPSGIGGDAIRMVELKSYAEHTSDTVTSVIVDRFLGLSALQAIAILGLIYDWGAVPAAMAYFTVTIFIAGLVAGYLLINRPLYLQLQKRVPLFRRLTEFKMVSNLFNSFQRYPLGALGRSYLISLCFNLVLISMNVFIGLALGAKASLVQYAVIVPITSLVLLIPISFAGLGVREEAYRRLFSQIGLSEETAVALSLLVYFFGNICTGFVGGVIYMGRSLRSLAVEKG
jgi:hypothetical protein